MTSHYPAPRIRPAVPRRTVALLVLALGAAALTACAPAHADAKPAVSATPSSAYPFSVQNCGQTETFSAPPQRVVTIRSTATEMLLALGLQDRIVGTAFQDGPVSPLWKDRATALTSLSDKVPGQEAVLTHQPDLVYAGWESNLTAEGAGDRATLKSLGVATLVAPAACKGSYQPHPLRMQNIFDEITEVGRIFDVPDRAADLVASQQKRLKAVKPDTRGLTALWYSSGSATPYVGAGAGAPELVMDKVGLKNIASTVDDSWTPMSWEAVIAADPDVIVLVDSAWGSVQKKIGVLEQNPATAALTAVRNKHYLIVPFPASEAGVRTVEAVETLHTQLAALTDLK